LLVASDTDSATVLCDAASAYTVDINAIAVEGKQEFAAKVKTRKASQSTAKAGKKADWSTNAVTKCSEGRHAAALLYCRVKIVPENPC
jgi:hypothetical protein